MRIAVEFNESSPNTMISTSAELPLYSHPIIPSSALTIPVNYKRHSHSRLCTSNKCWSLSVHTLTLSCRCKSMMSEMTDHLHSNVVN